MHAHLAGEDAAGIIKARDMLDQVGSNWKDFLVEAMNHADTEFEQYEKTGRHMALRQAEST